MMDLLHETSALDCTAYSMQAGFRTRIYLSASSQTLTEQEALRVALVSLTEYFSLNILFYLSVSVHRV